MKRSYIKIAKFLLGVYLLSPLAVILFTAYGVVRVGCSIVPEPPCGKFQVYDIIPSFAVFLVFYIVPLLLWCGWGIKELMGG